MPSASQDTIDTVAAFLPEVSDTAACEYLEAHGYALTPQWEWRKQGASDYMDMTDREYACLVYLVHEWDYGGLVK